MKELIVTPTVTIGADPEIFIANKRGTIVGSEFAIPEEGVSRTGGTVVRDGVQAEFQPSASTCRDSLCQHIAYCFQTLNEELKKNNLDAKVATTREVTEREFNRLSEDSKKFGCEPSLNVYEKTVGMITVDPNVDRNRSCGGHIHLGAYNNTRSTLKTLHNFDELVPLLDLLVANTFVLLESGAEGAKRREVYGKAGEFRKKSYGLEYRTLSNVWLRSRPLAHLAFGLARMAVDLTHSGHAKAILAQVNQKEVIEAINTNNFELALKNFKKASAVWLLLVGESSRYPIVASNYDSFMYLVENGIDNWFNYDPMQHWLSHVDWKAGQVGHVGMGSRQFLDHVVGMELKKKKLKEFGIK